MGNARLAGVELGGGLVAELLAALVADQGHGDSAVGQGRGVDSRLLLVGLQLVQRGVLRLFQPIHGSLYCVYIPVSHSHLGTSGLFEIVVGSQGGGKGGGAALHPPDFFTASSARALSNPISRSCSKSEGAMLGGG